jgi:hypothetical protein
VGRPDIRRQPAHLAAAAPVRLRPHRARVRARRAGRALVGHLLDAVVAPGGRLILCGYGSPRSAVPADPVHAFVLSHGLEPELALGVAAPEGGGAILELAVLRAG